MNTVKNQDSGSNGGVPDVARKYKEAGVNWVGSCLETRNTARAALGSMPLLSPGF